MTSAVIANRRTLQFSIEVYIDQRAKFNCAGSSSGHHFITPQQRIYSENLNLVPLSMQLEDLSKVNLKDISSSY